MFPFCTSKKIQKEGDELIINNLVKKLDEYFKNNNQNDYKFTPISLINAFKNNDYEKMKYCHEKLKIPISEYMIDEATENGNMEMVKFLTFNYNKKPSLYAKQMAEINGHKTMSLWIDKFAGIRNNVDISSVHRKHTKDGVKWSDIIPEAFRFY